MRRKKRAKHKKSFTSSKRFRFSVYLCIRVCVFLLITATQGKRNIWHGILQKQTSAKQMHTAKFNHRVADIFYGNN